MEGNFFPDFKSFIRTACQHYNYQFLGHVRQDRVDDDTASDPELIVVVFGAVVTYEWQEVEADRYSVI